jgi:arylsulfatase A-like enzyme
VNVQDLSINADLAPTIVEVANASPGLVMDGRSLIPVVQQPGIERGRQLLIEQAPFVGTLEEQASFKAIRTERYIYAEHGTLEEELYDLKKDPFELESRHDDPAYASVKAELAAHLQVLQSCAGPNCLLHSAP